MSNTSKMVSADEAERIASRYNVGATQDMEVPRLAHTVIALTNKLEDATDRLVRVLMDGPMTWQSIGWDAKHNADSLRMEVVDAGGRVRTVLIPLAKVPAIMMAAKVAKESGR